MAGLVRSAHRILSAMRRLRDGHLLLAEMPPTSTNAMAAAGGQATPIFGGARPDPVWRQQVEYRVLDWGRATMGQVCFTAIRANRACPHGLHLPSVQCVQISVFAFRVLNGWGPGARSLPPFSTGPGPLSPAGLCARRTPIRPGARPCAWSAGSLGRSSVGLGEGRNRSGVEPPLSLQPRLPHGLPCVISSQVWACGHRPAALSQSSSPCLPGWGQGCGIRALGSGTGGGGGGGGWGLP